MAYIVRNQLISPATQLYTISNQSKKKLIVGLGNIGDKYVNNRHNAGFMALDALAMELDVSFVNKKDLFALVAIAHRSDMQLILAKPTTLMNNSGVAVKALIDYYDVRLEDVLVIHDDIDIAFTEVREKLGGGSAGQNGIKSLITQIGGGFKRIRIGIGPKEPAQINTADFVLQDFTVPQRKKLPSIIKRVVDTIFLSI